MQKRLKLYNVLFKVLAHNQKSRSKNWHKLYSGLFLHNSTGLHQSVVMLIPRAVARTLIGGGGGVYSYIHVLPDKFLFKSNSNWSIWNEICRAKHEYMNIHPPINVLATALLIPDSLLFAMCHINPVTHTVQYVNTSAVKVCRLYLKPDNIYWSDNLRIFNWFGNDIEIRPKSPDFLWVFFLPNNSDLQCTRWCSSKSVRFI